MLALPEEMLAAHGHVHLLVNNAGVSLAGRFEDMSLEDLDWIFGVNFWGVVHGCKAFLPYLRCGPEAHILNIIDWMTRLSPELSQAVTAKLSQHMPF